MGIFWECDTCFEQHGEISDANKCCDDRKSALVERAATIAWLRNSPHFTHAHEIADAIETGEHLR